MEQWSTYLEACDNFNETVAVSVSKEICQTKTETYLELLCNIPRQINNVYPMCTLNNYLLISLLLGGLILVVRHGLPYLNDLTLIWVTMVKDGGRLAGSLVQTQV